MLSLSSEPSGQRRLCRRPRRALRFRRSRLSPRHLPADTRLMIGAVLKSPARFSALRHGIGQVGPGQISPYRSRPRDSAHCDTMVRLALVRSAPAYRSRLRDSAHCDTLPPGWRHPSATGYRSRPRDSAHCDTLAGNTVRRIESGSTEVARAIQRIATHSSNIASLNLADVPKSPARFSALRHQLQTCQSAAAGRCQEFLGCRLPCPTTLLRAGSQATVRTEACRIHHRSCPGCNAQPTWFPSCNPGRIPILESRISLHAQRRRSG